jgi:hypothetical protein
LSPGRSDCAAAVGNRGVVIVFGVMVGNDARVENIGVRPALWLNL